MCSSDLGKVGLAPILQHISGSQRCYEPKGRQLLKGPSKRNPKEAESKSVFTEEDFEAFRQSYFAHSAPIRRQAGHGVD